MKAEYAIAVKGARKQQSRSLSASSILWAKEERSIIIEFGSSRDNAEAGIITGFVLMDGSYQLALSTGADSPRAITRWSFITARLNITRGVISVYHN